MTYFRLTINEERWFLPPECCSNIGTNFLKLIRQTLTTWLLYFEAPGIKLCGWSNTLAVPPVVL